MRMSLEMKFSGCITWVDLQIVIKFVQKHRNVLI